MPPSIVNGTELGAQELRDIIFLCYGIDTPYLPPNFNICGEGLFISHNLDYNKGVLVTIFHNELCDRVTCPESPSPPHTCALTPSSTQIASCMRERSSGPGLQKKYIPVCQEELEQKRGSIDLIPLSERDKQFSRHACHEYGRPFLQEQATR